MDTMLFAWAVNDEAGAVGGAAQSMNGGAAPCFSRPLNDGAGRGRGARRRGGGAGCDEGEATH
jgi:hypothetical protein